MSSTLRRTRSFCFGTTGWFPTGRMSKAGRSARAITSTRTWRQSGSTNDQIEEGLPRMAAARVEVTHIVMDAVRAAWAAIRLEWLAVNKDPSAAFDADLIGV